MDGTQGFLFGTLFFLAQTPLVVFTIEGVVIVVLLMASALISGSEVACFSLTPDQIELCKKKESTSARNLIRLLHFPRRLLAIILILNNLVNVSLVTLATHMMVQAVGNNDQQALAISILTLVITFAIVFFGEVVPKVIANQHTMRFALMTSNTLLFFGNLVNPLAWILVNSTQLIEKRITKTGYIVSTDELTEAVEITTKHDETSDDQKDILMSLVNFGSISAKQIMRSRLDITALDIETPFHELLDKINKCSYSRIPIYRDTVDSIEGILYIKDLLPHIDRENEYDWQVLVRHNTYFVPENKKISSLLKEFQEKRVHMAIVVDEYGGTSGLITMEDIIEEIVGEINDEFDFDNVVYKQIDRSTYNFEAKVSLNDFCKITDTSTSVFADIKGENESLAGILLELFRRMPRVGESVSYRQFVFVIAVADHKRIKKVRVLIRNNESIIRNANPSSDEATS